MLLGNVAHLVLHSKWITSAVERQLQAGRERAATIIQPGGARDRIVAMGMIAGSQVPHLEPTNQPNKE
jgi:hypothetical protein